MDTTQMNNEHVKLMADKIMNTIKKYMIVYNFEYAEILDVILNCIDNSEKKYNMRPDLQSVDFDAFIIHSIATQVMVYGEKKQYLMDKIKNKEK